MQNAHKISSATCSLRIQSFNLLWAISHWALIKTLRDIESDLKAGFNPDQPRDEHGRWVETGGDEEVHSDNQDQTESTPDAIEPVYPIESVITTIYGIRGAASTLRGAFSAIQRMTNSSNKALTNHGALRLGERSVTKDEIQNAISSAKRTGATETKIGKYGTEQIHYRGTNGITVVIEQQGRNAGKVITLYRH